MVEAHLWEITWVIMIIFHKTNIVFLELHCIKVMFQFRFCFLFFSWFINICILTLPHSGEVINELNHDINRKYLEKTNTWKQLKFD